MIRSAWALATIVLMAHSAQAQVAAGAPVASTSAPTASVPEAQVRTFLGNLQAGKSSEAVDGLLGSATTPGQKPGERENLLTQIGAAVQAYGPIVAHEKMRSDMLGTMLSRQYFLVQHRDMVVRWEFVFVRTGAGWQLDYFGFDDQPRAWF